MMGQDDTLVVDKTGTLTEGRPGWPVCRVFKGSRKTRCYALSPAWNGPVSIPWLLFVRGSEGKRVSR